VTRSLQLLLVASRAYDVAIEKAGFKLAKLTAAGLTVGAVATLDVKLEVGAVADTSA